MKIAIIGSRNADESCYDLILEKLPAECSEIVSGGAEGIDTMAKRIAEQLGLGYKAFLPDYEKYGKSAPIRRNDQIIEYSDYVLVFWDFKSKGTQYTVNECIKRNIPFKIIGI